MTAVVFDFENNVSRSDAPLGGLATDAVAKGLVQSGRYEVISRDEVDKVAVRLGIHRPFDRYARRRIANELGASAIVDGRVAFVK